MKDTLLVTAIYGDYDEPKPKPKQSIDFDYVLFTDNPKNWQYDVIGWFDNVILDSKENSVIRLNPRLRAKKAKMDLVHSSLDISQYKYIVWIDAQCEIIADDYLEFMKLNITEEKQIAFVPHWVRSSYIDEWKVSLTEQTLKYSGSGINDQVLAYKYNQLIPEDFGLWAGTSFIYKPEIALNTNLFEDWLYEELKYATADACTNDQISLVYAVWKNKMKERIANIDYTEWKKRLNFTHHKRND